MENTISLTATAEGETKKVSFQLIKKEKTVCVKAYFDGGKEGGEIEIKMDDFNDFCLNLFNEHKKIFSDGGK